MDLKQLEYFVRVAELGSFTRYSIELGVAQPALSRQVRSLEVELRQNLFERNGRGVTLTDAGSRLLAHGRGILQQVQRARQELEALRGTAAGALALGLPPSLSRSLTAPLVEAFRARLPAATLTVVEGLSTYMVEWLVQGRVDCAAVYNATPSPAVELQPVLEERLYLVSARGKARTAVGPPVSLAEVAARPLVIPTRPHAIRMQIETALAEAGVETTAAEDHRDADGVPSRGVVLANVRDDEGLRVRLSTVDDFDLVDGRIATVLATADLGRDVTGRYGFGAGAEAPMPAWWVP